MLDFRTPEEYRQTHIRKSINVTAEDYQQKLSEALAGPKERVYQYRSHYEGDDIKRVLFIFPASNWKALEAQVNKELPVLNEEHLIKAYTIRISKAYFLKDFDDFKKKYPYLCVGGTSSERELVKAEARYPCEIK